MRKDQIDFKRFEDMIRKPDGSNEWLKDLDFKKLSKTISKEISTVLKTKIKIELIKRFYKGRLSLEISSNNFASNISLKIFEEAYIVSDYADIDNKGKEYFMQLSVALTGLNNLENSFNFATIYIDPKNNVKLKLLK